MLFRLYAAMILQFWPRCEAVMWRIQTAWLGDCRLATGATLLALPPALRSVPVNDRVWGSIVLWLKCVLQYFCWAGSWSWIWAKPFPMFLLEPMTWENLRPKILARYDFSGYAGEASWDQSDSSDMVGLARPRLGLAMCKNSGFWGLAKASPCIKRKLSMPPNILSCLNLFCRFVFCHVTFDLTVFMLG